MEKAVELLSESATRIKYRASDQLKSRSAKLRYNNEKHCLEIEFVFGKDDEAQQDLEVMVAIMLKDVQSVHREDYIEKARLSYVVALHMHPTVETDGQSGFYKPLVQHVLVFMMPQDRDPWFAGLSQIQEMLPGKPKDTLTVVGLLSRIKKVRLEEPRAGIVVAMRLNLANQEELLEVSQQQVDDRTLKKDIAQWVKVHNVEPNELTSLYRLVKSLVHRWTMEVKTAHVVQKINDLHFDNFIGAHGGDSAEVLERVNRELAQLDYDMPQQIGQHGVGSFMIIQTLRRNTQKMQLINKQACQIYDQHAKTRA
eukprot:TRINITY_DN105322_c0_g1_i1.p1 TRINITY_DN105322_c0_g1~~TRINITY_DN105322_c0_g1_i1.p1  ORF type:complete len:340 (-),score=70.98 TRINITY_DN105322_c0_g1_i1:338-1270(-)